MQYLSSNGNVRITSDGAISISKQLPLGTYQPKLSDQGFFLEPTSRMENVVPMFGEMSQYVDRCINTFKSRSCNTGVLLCGIPGSGKSLFIRTVCKKLERELPIILLNAGDVNPGIMQGMRSIDCDSVIVLDELDKVDSLFQPLLLTFLDGIGFSGRRLVLAACNFRCNINSLFLNRPGRFFYRFDFDQLPMTTIKEYLSFKLNDKSLVDELAASCFYIQDLSFDILSSIAEECNRYGELPSSFMGILNLTERFFGDYRVDKFTVDGEDVEVCPGYTVDLSDPRIGFSLVSEDRIWYIVPEKVTKYGYGHIYIKGKATYNERDQELGEAVESTDSDAKSKQLCQHVDVDLMLSIDYSGDRRRFSGSWSTDSMIQ